MASITTRRKKLHRRLLLHRQISETHRPHDSPNTETRCTIATGDRTTEPTKTKSLATSPRQGTKNERPRIDRMRSYKGKDDENLWRITCFFVDKDYRGKGVAKEALAVALK